MSHWLAYIGIKSGRVVDDSVIPTSDVSSFPSPPDGRVGLLGKAVFQERERIVALGLGHADDTRDKARVDKDRFESRDRVDADHRVDSVNGFSEGDLVACCRARGGLVVASVNRRQ
jgi:hypothetical protein